MPLRNEDEREANRVTEIPVQKEEAVAGMEKAIGPDEGEIVTGGIR